MLDIDTCIYWLNGVQSVRENVIRVGEDRLYISIVTLAELKFGAYNSNRVNDNLRRICDFLSKVKVILITDEIADLFGKIKSELRRKGQIISDIDIFIICTGIANEMIIVSNNEEHFNRVAGITIQNWTN